MTITLIDYTGKGRVDEEWHAADILLFTKGTRLSMTPDGLDAISVTPKSAKRAELALMAKTIPSSWEFVDVTFLLEGVTRACAQQITRTRNASYAMQSQRAVDMSGATITNPFSGGADPDSHRRAKMFTDFAAVAMDGYQHLLQIGAAPQDARGILPINSQCNLVTKYNLRAFVDLVSSRSSLRTQGEYAEYIHQAKTLVVQAWPWAEPFFKDPSSMAIDDLIEIANELGVEPGTGLGWRIAKAIDLLRR